MTFKQMKRRGSISSVSQSAEILTDIDHRSGMKYSEQEKRRKSSIGRINDRRIQRRLMVK